MRSRLGGGTSFPLSFFDMILTRSLINTLLTIRPYGCGVCSFRRWRHPKKKHLERHMNAWQRHFIILIDHGLAVETRRDSTMMHVELTPSGRGLADRLYLLRSKP